ncbi:Putative protein of unknown function [Podospora comata]|uniref:Uncharacterized protein n=1 Tax=Podospora comata TaxID=48703 RepID=A0ABY6RWQ2_PODCO|nr:Putative protein of unknown function [Podospora comata]
MSSNDRQPTPSEDWSVISRAEASDFVDETHTKGRKPHFNDDNIPSGRIGHDAATSFEEELHAVAHTQRAMSNEDSTETAGTDDTQFRVDDAADQALSMQATPSNFTPNATSPSQAASTPDILTLSFVNMELHQDTCSQYVERWVRGAGARRLVQHQAPVKKGYSSSVASTRSVVSNSSWTHVMEPISINEQLMCAGDWSNEALAPYGAPHPAGN